MSDRIRIALVGATGLVGRMIIQQASASEQVALVGIARRETELPKGAKMEMVIADPANWGEVLAAVEPDVLVNTLGTTWKRAGRDEDAFRAVDQELVLATARAAVEAGATRMVSVSSVGADMRSKNFYLKVKGEVEKELRESGFKRLDILRPGLLKGPRERDMRIGEGLARIASPLIDPMLRGDMIKYRSITGETVAKGALELALRKAAGKFVHDNGGIWRAARDWDKRAG